MQELLILSILILRVITNTFITATGDTALARTEESTINIGVEDSSVKAPPKTALAMKPVLKVATTQEDVTTPTPEAPIVTTKMRQFLTQLAHVLLGGESVPSLVSESTSVTIVQMDQEVLFQCPHQLRTS